MPRQIGVYNTTSLHEDHHGQLVHRDYLAHALRWSAALKHIKPGMTVVDAGCGTDQPLLKAIANFPHPIHLPARYVGIDIHPIENPLVRPWSEVITGVSIFSLDPKKVGPADVVVCFEMIEHMPRVHGQQLLRWLREAMADDGVLLLSTPVRSGRDLPVNHVYEWGFEELRNELEETGFMVDRVTGTFMTIPRLRKGVRERRPELLPTLADLEDVYDAEVMSAVFAPLFPDLASNCLWRVTK